MYSNKREEEGKGKKYDIVRATEGRRKQICSKIGGGRRTRFSKRVKQEDAGLQRSERRRYSKRVKKEEATT